MKTSSQNKVQCVILAGGLATRMRPLTEKLPKTLLPVSGRSFADFQLSWLAHHGVTDVVYCIGYKGEMIRDYVGDGSRWDLRATYVDEGHHLLGTAGALRLAYDQGVLEPCFLMTYGDSFLPVNFLEVWREFKESSSSCLMTVLRNNGKWDKSNTIFADGRVILYDKFPSKIIEEKMNYIDYGLLALDRSIISQGVPPNEKSDLATLLKQLSLRGVIAGYEVKERFYEIGSPAGLRDFSQWIETHQDNFSESS